MYINMGFYFGYWIMKLATYSGLKHEFIPRNHERFWFNHKLSLPLLINILNNDKLLSSSTPIQLAMSRGPESPRLVELNYCIHQTFRRIYLNELPISCRWCLQSEIVSCLKLFFFRVFFWFLRKSHLGISANRYELHWQTIIPQRPTTSELSTGRMDPWVGSGRVTILPDFVGSGQHFGFSSCLLIIPWYLNRYESSNTVFGLIDFLRYVKYNN